MQALFELAIAGIRERQAEADAQQRLVELYFQVAAKVLAITEKLIATDHLPVMGPGAVYQQIRPDIGYLGKPRPRPARRACRHA